MPSTLTPIAHPFRVAQTVLVLCVLGAALLMVVDAPQTQTASTSGTPLISTRMLTDGMVDELGGGTQRLMRTPTPPRCLPISRNASRV